MSSATIWCPVALKAPVALLDTLLLKPSDSTKQDLPKITYVKKLILEHL